LVSLAAALITPANQQVQREPLLGGAGTPLRLYVRCRVLAYQIAEVINHHRQAMSRFFPWHFHENALFT
jgi:hypothetical protein